MIIIINDLVLIIMFKYERKPKKNKKQIIRNNITNMETIYGRNGNIGNALIMINNLIKKCEKIKCKNIICPKRIEK